MFTNLLTYSRIDKINDLVVNSACLGPVDLRRQGIIKATDWIRLRLTSSTTIELDSFDSQKKRDRRADRKSVV